MKITSFLLLNLFLFLNCKQVKIEKPSINSSSKTEEALAFENQMTSFDSLPNWKELKLGSNYILNSFPRQWSYPSIISDDYDEFSKNEFNKYLEIISTSYNLEKLNLSVINIPHLKLIIKDEDLEYLNYPISINNDKIYQLYKLNDNFLVGIFKQEENKPINNISKRIDLIVFDLQFNITDKINILFEGNGDQHAFMKYFYIDKDVLQTRSFYVYDGESSASLIKNFQISNEGKMISQ